MDQRAMLWWERWWVQILSWLSTDWAARRLARDAGRAGVAPQLLAAVATSNYGVRDVVTQAFVRSVPASVSVPLIAAELASSASRRHERGVDHRAFNVIRMLSHMNGEVWAPLLGVGVERPSSTPERLWRADFIRSAEHFWRRDSQCFARLCATALRSNDAALVELARTKFDAMPPETVVCALVSALSGDAATAEGAAIALRSLRAAAARDILIERVLSSPTYDHLLPLILESRYHHSQDEKQWLFLVLAGRMDEYFAHGDFACEELRHAYQRAPELLKERLHQSIERAGDTRLNELFLKTQQAGLQPDLSAHACDTVVLINIRRQNWRFLFDNLYFLPARSIVAVVIALRNSGWAPEGEEDAAHLEALGTIVDMITPAPGDARDIPRHALPWNPILRRWHEQGRVGAADGVNEDHDLHRNLYWNYTSRTIDPHRLRSEYETDERIIGTLHWIVSHEGSPPCVLAALAALEARGQLTHDDMKHAEKSDHWLVRFTALSLGASSVDAEPGGSEWMQRLNAVFAPLRDAEVVWGDKPCEVTPDGFTALREGIASLPDKRMAAGLLLVEAVTAHKFVATAHDIEIGVGSPAVSEDAIEIAEQDG